MQAPSAVDASHAALPRPLMKLGKLRRKRAETKHYMYLSILLTTIKFRHTPGTGMFQSFGWSGEPLTKKSLVY
jgi:hypothetical protein